MRCPNCSGSTVVRDSRKKAMGRMIWRKRECPQCGYRIATHEKPALGIPMQAYGLPQGAAGLAPCEGAENPPGRGGTSTNRCFLPLNAVFLLHGQARKE